ncbi:MAG: U32 family peptidase [Pirellulaceae bacterium]|nr:U32 family peptidase [Pirellulaceae bacterium]
MVASEAGDIELLAPAGNWDCARAAIENGADAIYFGLDVGFNARARATNFHLNDLPKLMDTLHRQAVRGYVTLNTLVFTDELQRLEDNVRQLADAGVDAVLVQDLGAARLIRQLCPNLTLHASTQMTLTCAAAIQQIQELGIRRVVLARELSISEITAIHAATSMPLETFVHGALCVAYSGQCLTSESLGGRSANRGQCAQACRLPYDLICDGQQRDLGAVKYLLSPQDLAAHDWIPQLLQAGVCSLKIEGRLKTAEYVANVCQHYRRALDAALTGQHRRLTPTQKSELELSFSRGFSPGWLDGCDHKQLVPGLSSAKRGILLGTVVRQLSSRLTIDLVTPLAVGDGIVVEGNRFSGEELGGRIYQMWQNGQPTSGAASGQVQIAMQHGVLEKAEVSSGTRVFKTDDPQLTKRLRQSFQTADPVKRVPVDIHVRVAVGQPIQLTAQMLQPVAPDQQRPLSPVTLTSDFLPAEARNRPLDHAMLQQQLGRLGGTVYTLRWLTAEFIGQPMVPLSILGQLRRQLIEGLDAANVTRPLACDDQPVALRMLDRRGSTTGPPTASKIPPAPVTLRILCRSLSQLEQVLSLGTRSVIADFHDLRQYRQAIQMARQSGADIELATLRIHKPGEDGLLHALRKHCQPTDATDAPSGDSTTRVGWLARNLAAVRYCRQHGIPFATDFSLNVTNPLTLDQLRQWGAGRITASYDLNRDQLLELTAACDSELLEVVIHQHMPMFHMEHCVFCSVLSPGKNKSDCGRPCDRHDVQLRDRVGVEHVLHADIGCRNTLYNAVAQSGAEAVARLRALGVRHFRVELLRDSSLQHTQRLVQLYQQLVDGQVDGSQVWRELQADNRIGVTRGTLEQPRNPLAIL